MSPSQGPLVLFTANHPFSHQGGETMFVAPELAHLAEVFEKIYLVPLRASGVPAAMPTGVVVDTRLARYWRYGKGLALVCAPLWPGFAAEFWRGVRHGGWVGAARVWRWAAVAWCTRAWLRGARLAPASLLYTYWRGGQTLAALHLAARSPGARVVTRVHGYDLYAEAFRPAFQPWESLYASVDAVLTVSEHGHRYLQQRGVARQRVHTFRLGVAPAPLRAKASADKVLRLLSCSHVSELKRVDRVAQALIFLAQRHPQQLFHWTHFGAGPAWADLVEQLRRRPVNLQVDLQGAVSNDRVLAHYATSPVDLFILLSRSEGLPVSIQEALAAGVPVLATDVGGVSEAVLADGENGCLLSSEVRLEEVASAVESLLLGGDAAAKSARRDAAWRLWSQRFDARTNHRALAQFLGLLLKSSS